MNIAGYIDHTLLKQAITDLQIEQLCKEAIQYNFPAVCVLPYFVELAKKNLRDTPIKVATVIGFPLGTHYGGIKASEILVGIEDGADEFDAVLNLHAIKSGNWDYVENEIHFLRALTEDKILKIIIETSLLTKEEKVEVAKLVCKYKCDFVKTSTGFFGGATVEDVKLLRMVCDLHQPSTQVKASGGIKTYQQALDMINVGATRIGTSSGVQIMLEEKNAGQS